MDEHLRFLRIFIGIVADGCRLKSGETNLVHVFLCRMVLIWTYQSQ